LGFEKPLNQKSKHEFIDLTPFHERIG